MCKSTFQLKILVQNVIFYTNMRENRDLTQVFLYCVETSSISCISKNIINFEKKIPKSWITNNRQWARNGKKWNLKCVFKWLHDYLRLKSSFLEIFSSLHWPFQNHFIKKIAQNLDFSLRQTVGCPKIELFPIFSSQCVP